MTLIEIGGVKKKIVFDSEKIKESVAFTFWRGRKFEVWINGKSERISYLNLLKEAVHDQTLHTSPYLSVIKKCLSSMRNCGYESSGKFETIASPLTRILTKIKHFWAKQLATRLFAKLPLTAEEKFKHYEALAEKGNTGAKAALIDGTINGMGAPKDEDKAYFLLKKLVYKEKGSLQKGAFYDILSYVRMKRTKIINEELAKGESPKARLMQMEGEAALGKLEALTFLGICYLLGIAVSKDEKKAVEYFQKSYDLRARWFLGYCSLKGMGIPKNETAAFTLFEKLADEGHKPAQCSLADCYLEALGVEPDAPRAVALYQKLALENDPFAQYQLAYCYRNGIGVEKDLAKAVTYYQKAADLGHLFAAYCLGYCNSIGIGTSRNEREAKRWFDQVNEGIGPFPLVV